MDAERSRRFQRFIKEHVDAFADVAEYGFSSRGRGAVHLIVDQIEGGEAFDRQQRLSLTYMPASDIGNDQILADVVQRCDFPKEAVVVASYRDGTRDILRVALAEMRQALANRPSSGQWTPDPGTRK